MHEFRDSGEWVLLAVTRRAVLAIAAVVHVAVATGAVLAESQKAFFAHRQQVHVGVGVARFAADRQVLSLQTKVQTLVLEPR